MAATEARIIYETLDGVRPTLQRGVPVALVDHYVGSVDGMGRFEGRGRATLALHDVIEGDFVAGAISRSPGVLRYPDGYAATGPLTGEGVPSGADCTIRWPSGETYAGALVNGVRHGCGTQTSACGRAVYTGNWHRGVRQGRGAQRYADGSHYDGDWEHDERHGQGTLWYASGDCYEGSWSHGERVGEGCMGWRHDTPQFVEIYQGTWQAGQPHGMGSSTYIRPVVATKSAADAVTDDAEVAEVVPSQYAAPVTAIVNRYVGEFAQGERHGRGTFFYADGSSYEGGWVHGERAGKGLITTTVGAVVVVTAGSQSSAGTSACDDALLEPSTRDGGRKNRNAQLVPEVRVGDLRGLTDGTEEQFTTTITSLLLRYNTSLKALFTRYAAISDHVELLFTPADWWRHRTPGHLGVTQFLRLLSDAGVIGGAITTAAFIRCVAEAMRNAAEAVQSRLCEQRADNNSNNNSNDEVSRAIEAARAQLYRLDGSVHYRTFAESLIRLAPLVCVGPRFRGLGDQVAALMEEYLRAPLSFSPLFPVTRRYMRVLRPQSASLADAFNHAVRLQLPQRDPFLPALVLLRAMEPVLRRIGVSPMQAVPCVQTAPQSTFTQKRALPPGFSEPNGDMAATLYRVATGNGDQLRLSTAVADQELTLLDFVEVLASIAELVARADASHAAAAASVDVVPDDAFDGALTGIVMPTLNHYLSTL